MEVKKNNNGLIIALIIFIVLSIGLGGFIVHDEVLSSDAQSQDGKKDNSDNDDKESDILPDEERLFCESSISTNGDIYKYKVFGEGSSLIIKVFDINDNVIFRTERDYSYYDYNDVLHDYDVSTMYEHKYEYCEKNKVQMSEISSDNGYKYLAIYGLDFLYGSLYKIMLAKNDVYNELLDLTDFSGYGVADANTNQEIDTFRIINNELYVIEMDCEDANGIYYKELKFNFYNGTYTVTETGNTNFVPYSGMMC